MGIILTIWACLILYVCETTKIYGAEFSSDSTEVVVEPKRSLVAAPLSSTLSIPLNPGIYESDDIEHILSFSLADFGDQDLIMFDIDETLITHLDPYYYAHRMNNTHLNQKLTEQPKHISEKFVAYQFISSPYALMDERIPSLVKKLQERRVSCIANTTMYSSLPSVESANVPSLRVKSLQAFAIDFSATFPQLPHWDFNTMEAAHIVRFPPIFKDGIILSSETPKHITTLELFKKLGFKPRRVAFVDDVLDNNLAMYEDLDAKGIECYCFHYTKAHKSDPQSYFPSALFDLHLIELETTLEKLFHAEDGDLFQKLLANDGVTKVHDLVIERSFFLQKFEHQAFGEKIYVTSEMNSINYILQHPRRDLAVFDIDDTLIASIHPYFDVHYRPNTPLNQSLSASNKSIRDRFFFGILPTNPFVLMEPQTPKLITSLQSNGMKVIALTSLQPFISKEINLNIPNWQVNNLRTFGYEFSKSFPIPLLYGFGGSNSQVLLDPYFQEGVMFANSISKGKALLSFLRTMSFKPKSVLFVDDNVQNVISVYRELSTVGVKCHAILYTRTHKLPAKSMFSEELYDSHLQKQVQIIEDLLQLEKTTIINSRYGSSINKVE